MTINSNEALLAVLAQPPVSVAIEADSVFFQLYSDGCHAALTRHEPRSRSSCRQLWFRRQDGKVYDEIAFEYTVLESSRIAWTSSSAGSSPCWFLQPCSCPLMNTFQLLRGAWSWILALAVRINLALKPWTSTSSTLYLMSSTGLCAVDGQPGELCGRT